MSTLIFSYVQDCLSNLVVLICFTCYCCVGFSTLTYQTVHVISYINSSLFCQFLPSCIVFPMLQRVRSSRNVWVYLSSSSCGTPICYFCFLFAFLTCPNQLCSVIWYIFSTFILFLIFLLIIYPLWRLISIASYLPIVLQTILCARNILSEIRVANGQRIDSLTGFESIWGGWFMRNLSSVDHNGYWSYQLRKLKLSCATALLTTLSYLHRVRLK